MTSPMVGGHFGDVVGARRPYGGENRGKLWLFHVYQINKPGREKAVGCVAEIVEALYRGR